MGCCSSISNFVEYLWFLVFSHLLVQESSFFGVVSICTSKILSSQTVALFHRVLKKRVEHLCKSKVSFD